MKLSVLTRSYRLVRISVELREKSLFSSDINVFHERWWLLLFIFECFAGCELLFFEPFRFLKIPVYKCYNFITFQLFRTRGFQRETRRTYVMTSRWWNNETGERIMWNNVECANTFIYAVESADWQTPSGEGYE